MDKGAEMGRQLEVGTVRSSVRGRGGGLERGGRLRGAKLKHGRVENPCRSPSLLRLDQTEDDQG